MRRATPKHAWVMENIREYLTYPEMDDVDDWLIPPSEELPPYVKRCRRVHRLQQFQLDDVVFFHRVGFVNAPRCDSSIFLDRPNASQK